MKQQAHQNQGVSLPVSIKRGQNYWWIAGLSVCAVFFALYLPIMAQHPIHFPLTSFATTCFITPIVIVLFVFFCGKREEAEIILSQTEIRIKPWGRQTIIRQISEFDRVESVDVVARQACIFLRVREKPVLSWWQFRHDYDDKVGDISIPVSFTQGGFLEEYKEMAEQLARTLGLKYRHVNINPFTGRPF